MTRNIATDLILAKFSPHLNPRPPVGEEILETYHDRRVFLFRVRIGQYLRIRRLETSAIEELREFAKTKTPILALERVA